MSDCHTGTVLFVMGLCFFYFEVIVAVQKWVQSCVKLVFMIVLIIHLPITRLQCSGLIIMSYLHQL